MPPDGEPIAAREATRGPRLRRRIAWAVALAADATQIVLAPMVLAGAVSPIDDVIDVVVFAVLTALLGWNMAFLPSFVVKLLPVVDLAPGWTLAVWLVTRRSKPGRG